jgi:hypothetical protein
MSIIQEKINAPLINQHGAFIVKWLGFRSQGKWITPLTAQAESSGTSCRQHCVGSVGYVAVSGKFLYRNSLGKSYQKRLHSLHSLHGLTYRRD